MSPARNDEFLVKRVIGLPNDHVSCKGRGAKIEINGKAIDETEYIKEGVNPSDLAFDVVVPDGMLFVLGDNRANSADSRYNTDKPYSGFVPKSFVVGNVVSIFWPFDHFKIFFTPESVFKGV
jgi:signal peptidase I